MSTSWAKQGPLPYKFSTGYTDINSRCLTIVADSVNRGISMARRIHTACKIRLSINKDLKLKERKGRDRQQREKLYTISRSHKGYMSSISTITSTITAVFCQCCNVTPPSEKACPQALYVRIITVGCSYLYTLLVVYYLYYTSIPSIYLGTLAVQIYQGNSYGTLRAYRDYL